jgi:hypothetical protein
VVEDGVEIDDRVVEVAELVHLLVEDRDGHRQGVARKVVDLVVHEHAQAAVTVAVRAERGSGLADRPVDRVLQDLFEAIRAHRVPSLASSPGRTSMLAPADWSAPTYRLGAALVPLFSGGYLY